MLVFGCKQAPVSSSQARFRAALSGLGVVVVYYPGLRGVSFHCTPLHPGLSKGRTFGAEDTYFKTGFLKNHELAGKL